MTRTLRHLAAVPFALLADLAAWVDTKLADRLNRPEDSP